MEDRPELGQVLAEFEYDGEIERTEHLCDVAERILPSRGLPELANVPGGEDERLAFLRAWNACRMYAFP